MLRVIMCKVEKYILFKNFSYLVYDTESKQGFIIDPAWELDIIENNIREYNIQLKGILITHAHYDHINLVNALETKYNCDVYIGDIELSSSTFSAKNLKTITTEDCFVIEEIHIYPIFTPGHTLGSICYLIEGNLFSGDTLFIEGCGMCFGDRASFHSAQLYQSLQKLKQIIPDNTKIYPGHSYGELAGQPMKELMKKNIYLNFRKENDFIAYRMRKGQKGLLNFK